jgi:predicted cupin superfamily sugar epimerase
VQTGRALSILLTVNAEAARLISGLKLVPLPGEGGFFARSWTSQARRPDGRAFASAILFLITGEDFSTLHRLAMEEIWLFCAGDPAELVRIDPRTGSCHACVLGPDVAGGHAPQAVVPPGDWQGARIAAGGSTAARGWSLFSCVVSPAWDERECELGQRDVLLREFPAHAPIVRALTR